MWNNDSSVLSFPILIFGKNGQLGRALSHALRNNQKLIELDHSQADFTNPGAIFDLLDKAYEESNFELIINAAAYTAVDQAEKEESLATQVNGLTPGLIAHWCEEKDIPLIHYSTDYVYPGTGFEPWKESDPTGPLNAYGRSKLLGDLEIQKSGAKHLIFRTSWVYDSLGKNFLNTMLRLGKEKEELKIVSDQYGAPTYAPHLASASLAAIMASMSSEVFPSGIFHLCNAGVTSWYSFAQEIFKQTKALSEIKPQSWNQGMILRNLLPISSLEYSTPAKRPLNSRLDLSRFQMTFEMILPDWKSGVKECLEAKQ